MDFSNLTHRRLWPGMALPGLLGATVPSVDDCSRTARCPPPQGWLECVEFTGWNGSEAPAALRRNKQRDALSEQIRVLLPEWSMVPMVTALQARHGVALVVAATPVAEAGDLSRFDGRW